MQRHAKIGARILQDLDILRDAAPVVLHHQERWDGRRDGKYPGYPAGLRGEADPPRLAHHRGGGRLRRDDHRPPLPQGMRRRTALAELAKEAGGAVRSEGGGGVRGLLAEHPWKAEQVA